MIYDTNMELAILRLEYCWDVWQCFVWQFKTDYVRQVEGLIFEKKNFVTDEEIINIPNLT